MGTWRDKIKTARLPEKTERIVMRGDLVAEHERLVAEITEAQQRGASSLAGAGTAALKAQLRELEADMQASVVEFRLRALPRTARADDGRPSWRDLMEQHPPRIDDGVMHVLDRLAGGVNRETFPEPMVRACVITIDGDPATEMSDADWDELLRGLATGQFDQLVNAGWALNLGEVDIPFWSGDSRPMGTTARA